MELIQCPNKSRNRSSGSRTSSFSSLEGYNAARTSKYLPACSRHHGVEKEGAGYLHGRGDGVGGPILCRYVISHWKIYPSPALESTTKSKPKYKPPSVAGFIVPTGIEILRDIAGRILPALTSSKPVCSQPNRQAIVFKEPYGVILGIAPWNAPYILGMRSICPALAAGNTVVLKGAERSPRCFWAISSIFAEAGLPRGVLNTIYVKPSDGAAVTSALISHPAVKKINFTGSSAVGRVIAEQAGRVLKPCLMELGGKAPAVILPGADLALAARECVNGAFMHAGQICMSTEKVIVPVSLLPAFEAQIERAFNAAYPDKRQCVTLVSTASKTRIDTLISDAIAKGAILLNGDSEAKHTVTNGNNSDHIGPNGTFTADTDGIDGTNGTSPTAKMRPHILKFLPPSSTLYHTESFGPVLCLMTYADGDEADALRLANDTEYGLSSSVFCGELDLSPKPSYCRLNPHLYRYSIMTNKC